MSTRYAITNFLLLLKDKNGLIGNTDKWNLPAWLFLTLGEISSDLYPTSRCDIKQIYIVWAPLKPSWSQHSKNIDTFL